MDKKVSIRVLMLFFLVMGCSPKSSEKIIVRITNTTDVERTYETVEINLSQIRPKISNDLNHRIFEILDAETHQKIISQGVDSDNDGSVDVVLFQPKIGPNRQRTFDMVPVEAKDSAGSLQACYSRFVPERTDDFAWENNRVAFRTYGPTAQKMIEDGIKGGTLSSGIDAWLKRVEYPIINKWYENEISGKASYHRDNGEGLDNFHVGASRGVGGVALKIDSTYHSSKNFTSWKHQYNGPIRTSFVLTYSDWNIPGGKLLEEKHITLDLGQNLSKIEVRITGTETISAGLTLHGNEGIVNVNEKEGWLSYWEPHEDSELGMGMVIPDNNLLNHEKYVTERKDLSNLFAHLKVENQKTVYFVGFGWKKSGQFESKAEWEEYLKEFSHILNHPLKVEIL